MPLPNAIRARPKASQAALPAPTKGLNTLDSLAEMDELYATTLDNFDPDAGACRSRGGSADHATGLGAAVETLFEYHAGSTRKLIAAAGGSFFDASSAGAVGDALAEGFTSSRWQWQQFSGKTFLVNGVDAPQTFDGSAFADSGWTGTGLTASDLIAVAVYKERLFFVEKASRTFWYPATAGAVTGALSSYDLGLVAGFGGNLAAIVPVGYDAGSGPADYLAFVMTSGDVILYSGTDPGNADAWTQIGRFHIGAPVGFYRAFVRYGAESYYTTTEDHVALSQWFAATKAGRDPPRSKIAPSAAAAVASSGSLFGWDGVVYKNRVIFNIPHADGSFHQHVYNGANGAWSRWTRLAAQCWAAYNGGLYFGTAGGTVVQADTGTSDNGDPIPLDGQQAWSSLRSPRRKLVAAARPVIQSSGAASYSFGIGYDFQDPAVADATPTPASGAVWDEAAWDTTPWGPETVTSVAWSAAGGSGQMVSPRVRVAALQPIAWLGTTFLVQPGQGL